MTLADRINLLAIAVREKLNTITPRLMPTGGALGQVIAKTGTANFAFGWQTPATGGSAANKQLAYAGGKIISVTASDGTVTTLNYTNDFLTSVVKVIGVQTVTKTLIYSADGKTIDKITMAVTVT